MLSRQSAAHALSGLVSASLAALVALGIVTGKVLLPYSMLGLSPGIIALVVAYLLGTRLIYFDTQESRRNSAVLKETQLLTSGRMRLPEALFGFAVCAGVICVAGPYLAKAAGALAERSGLGDTFIGTTLVALATSLPELVSMVAALRIGAIELAIGNVFGSNAFNVLLLVPLDVIQPGSLLAVVSPIHVVTCIAAVLATQVAVMGQLYQIESRIKVIEPDAWLVILIVVGSLVMIYYFPS
jgi:cation:H+ antiporter